MEGVDYHHRGRIDLQLLRSTLKLMRYQFYVCGPRQMMETLVPALAEWGVATNDIHYESFGPASLIKHENPTRQERKERQLRRPSPLPSASLAKASPGIRVPIRFWNSPRPMGSRWSRVAGQAVAVAARQASQPARWTIIRQPDADVESGHCLLCITTPKSDLTLVA